MSYAKLTAEQETAFQAGLIQGYCHPKNESGKLTHADGRAFSCPECSSFGMNTTRGYILFSCGAEVLPDGDEGCIFDKPCGKEAQS